MLTQMDQTGRALSDEEMHEVCRIARTDPPPLPLIGDKGFAAALAVLETLPRRRQDTLDGEVRFRVYRQCLSHLPAAQMWWTVTEAVKTSKFFPSVKELLDLAEGWHRDDVAAQAQALARRVAAREARRREAAAARRRAPPPPLTQADVDAMSPVLISMGLKCGALVKVDGKVVPNPEPDVEQIEGKAA